MPLTPKQRWPYPKEDQDPWYEAVKALWLAIDATAFASREDLQFILAGGGTISWDATSSTCTWTSSIIMMAAPTGWRELIAAGNVEIADGELVYVELSRAPQSEQTLTMQTASVLPKTDNVLVLAIRIGTDLYWRNGTVLGDGDSVVNWKPSAGFTANGDLSGDASTQTVIGIQGRTVAATAPTTGQVYKWSGTQWVPSADSANTMPTLVFRPGGTASGNVYVSWANLMAAFNTIEGPVWIDMDDVSGTLTIPTGTHDMEGRAVFRCRKDEGRNTMYLASGCVLQDPAGFEHMVVDAQAASTGYMQFAAGGVVHAFDTNFTTNSSVRTLIDASIGSTLILHDSDIVGLGEGVPVYQSVGADGVPAYIYQEGYAVIPTNVFGGSGDIEVWLENSWTTCSASHADLTGSLTINSPPSSSSAVQTTFVFKPGGTPADNVYDTWSLLMADLAAVNGPKVIEFDSSEDPNLRCDIPSGKHSLGLDTILRGRWGDSGKEVKVLMADGAKFEDASVLEGGLEIWSASTDVVFSWTDNQKHLILRETVKLYGAQYAGQAAPTSPLMDGYGIVLEMRDDSFLGASSGDQAIINTELESTNTLHLYDHAWVGAADGGTGDGYCFTFGVDAFLYVNIYDQAVYFRDQAMSNILTSLYCIRRHVIDLTKGAVSNPTVTPMACGANYVSFDSLPKHLNLTCKFRVIIETTSGTAGFEAYVDLYDAHGQLNAGTPQVVPGSQTDTGTGSAPTGAPTPNALVPSLYEVDLTSAILAATWVSDIAIFEARVWIGTAGGGNAAICKSAELIFEW